MNTIQWESQHWHPTTDPLNRHNIKKNCVQVRPGLTPEEWNSIWRGAKIPDFRSEFFSLQHWHHKLISTPSTANCKNTRCSFELFYTSIPGIRKYVFMYLIEKFLPTEEIFCVEYCLLVDLSTLKKMLQGGGGVRVVERCHSTLSFAALTTLELVTVCSKICNVVLRRSIGTSTSSHDRAWSVTLGLANLACCVHCWEHILKIHCASTRHPYMINHKTHTYPKTMYADLE